MTLMELSNYFWLIPWLLIGSLVLALGGLYEAFVKGGLCRGKPTMAEYKEICFLRRTNRLDGPRLDRLPTSPSSRQRASGSGYDDAA